MTETRPPLPPFETDTALQKVRAAEDAWNTGDREEVALAYTPDSVWRNRDTFVTGREQIVEFWGFRDNRIAVRFQYEWHDTAGQWWRSYGNELWEFTPLGLMSRREASINDHAIAADERRGPRPEAELW
ncbi:DUF1348 family protein [Arthrobacter sp. NicSoilB8]|uniref:DUF1348 family protein n=1 Tax=Arthrobacter sp. NicSoilB8 TaxID=2830998 RepID=UPI001CC40864|nr:DUF1348 family protein [Arthrobacter sp. NicSoilB8]BCW70842.1 hypothetical protein NicSoilB8_18860 [Arthrobacter sp. NicSoilB8]